MKEISDMRDETDLNGLKLTIDLKRGQDPDKLMQKLFQHDAAGGQLLLQLQYPHRRHAAGDGRAGDYWTSGRAFRTECVAPPDRISILQRQGKAPAPAQGLWKPSCWTSTRLSRIVRETEEEAEVVPNLMIGFGIDKIQAEYVAEIKLRHLNREYILSAYAGNRRILEAEIARLEDILEQPGKNQTRSSSTS